MKKIKKEMTNKNLLLSLLGLGLVAALILIPSQFRSQASGKGKGIYNQTKSDDPSLPNFDIRTDKVVESANLLNGFRESAGRNAVQAADLTEQFVTGESDLRRRMPTLKVELSTDLRSPEVIGYNTDGRIGFLAVASAGEKRTETLRNFIKQNNNLLGLSDRQANELLATADYTNPDGNLSYARLEQRINGISVFRGEANAGFTRNGEMFRIINNIAPGLDYSSLSTNFGNPADAVNSAAKYINHELKADQTTQNAIESTDLKAVFGSGDWATTAEKMYFPTEPGVARAAWRVLIWQPVNAFYVIVDAETGKMLWRKNITNDQTQPATYNVYTNPASMMNTSKNPAPIVPGILDPALATQGAVIPRNNVTLIGNEAPNTFNNNGWITDGTNGVNGTTDGNAVEAGLDIDGVNGVDATGKADGTARVFNFTYNPGPGNPAPGDAPTLPAFRNGAVTQLFYMNNRYHDELYKLGFTEPARNYQASNYGRGGAELDRVSGEAQDSSGTNNANFATPADGGRGRMQMYVFTGPTPDYDGDIDADIVVHEHTHGLSNRLIGNGSGLGNNRGGSMGEGWSDFYGLSLLSNPATPANSVNTTGDWATYLLTATYNFNYYYGIRRFPYALKAFTGGPNNRSHNPLTLADIDPAQINVADGAYVGNPVFVGNGATEVHNAGEVWCQALFEVRGRFIARLGAAAGNLKTLQLVTDGMKLTPLSPNFIQARDAIIAAAAASPAAPEASLDVADVREGFRIRGMGFGAVDGGTAVIESFLAPNVVLGSPFSVSDTPGNNNGVPEPGENVLLNIPVTNTTGATVNTVLVNVNGGTNVSYGNIADAATVSMAIPFTIPNVACGSTQSVTINISSASGTQAPQIRSFALGSPVGIVQNFDGVVAPALPAGWTATQDTGTVITWATTATGPSSAPNSAFANDPATVNMSSIETPPVPISSSSAQVKFRNKYVTESTFDGMVLEIKIGAGAYADIVTAGGSFVSGGYNATISATFSSPIAGRMAWSGTSAGGYIDSVVNLPAAANGQTVQLRWRMASDSSVASTGVNIDDVQIVSSFVCVAPASSKRSDFDGDGKTDLSVFRPSEGNWYMNRSTAGFGVVKFGIATDTITPGDVDGDNKTDQVVFRPSATLGTPDFLALRSATNTVVGAEWGTTGDLPVVSDYDGDNKDDYAIWRPTTGDFFVLQSATNGLRHYKFGTTGDRPVPADYSGDNRTDFAVYRPTTGAWYIADNATNVITTTFWGTTGDIPVFADYNGDTKDDIAVYRPSNGTWYILNSGGIPTYIPFGTSTDVPVPGDYDGDGKYDQAVYRAGTWYVNRSTSGVTVQPFGLATDTATPRAYLP